MPRVLPTSGSQRLEGKHCISAVPGEDDFGLGRLSVPAFHTDFRKALWTAPKSPARSSTVPR